MKRRTLRHNGETLTIPEWADRLGMSRRTIVNRLNARLTVPEVLDPEPRKNGKKGKRKAVGRDYERHGMSNTPEYRSWQMMKARCLPGHPSWEDYGGRGIKVCDRWVNSFKTFYEDMGPRPPGTTLDRKDLDGDYEPSNCRWATKVEQARNKRDNRILEYEGRRMAMVEWSEERGVPVYAIRNRLRLGWSVAEALEFVSLDHRKRKPGHPLVEYTNHGKAREHQ